MHHTLAASLVKWELRKIQNSIIIAQTWKESCGIIFLDKTERRVFNEKGWLDLSFPQLRGRGLVETVLPKELPNYFCCPRPLPMWCMDKCFLHNGLLLASTLEQPSVKECLKAKCVVFFFPSSRRISMTVSLWPRSAHCLRPSRSAVIKHLHC